MAQKCEWSGLGADDINPTEVSVHGHQAEEIPGSGPMPTVDAIYRHNLARPGRHIWRSELRERPKLVRASRDDRRHPGGDSTGLRQTGSSHGEIDLDAARDNEDLAGVAFGHGLDQCQTANADRPRVVPRPTRSAASLADECLASIHRGSLPPTCQEMYQGLARRSAPKASDGISVTR